MSGIQIVKDRIAFSELKRMALGQFGDFVKAAVDIEQEIIALGGELHADEEVVLVEEAGSKREYTWGINIILKNRKMNLLNLIQ